MAEILFASTWSLRYLCYFLTLTKVSRLFILDSLPIGLFWQIYIHIISRLIVKGIPCRTCSSHFCPNSPLPICQASSESENCGKMLYIFIHWPFFSWRLGRWSLVRRVTGISIILSYTYRWSYQWRFYSEYLLVKRGNTSTFSVLILKGKYLGPSGRQGHCLTWTSECTVVLCD